MWDRGYLASPSAEAGRSPAEFGTRCRQAGIDHRTSPKPCPNSTFRGGSFPTDDDRTIGTRLVPRLPSDSVHPRGAKGYHEDQGVDARGRRLVCRVALWPPFDIEEGPVLRWSYSMVSLSRISTPGCTTFSFSRVTRYNRPMTKSSSQVPRSIPYHRHLRSRPTRRI